MASSVLLKSMEAVVDAGAPVDQGCMNDRPHRPTRELAMVFAKRDGRWRLAGLAFALTASAGLWAVLASLMF